MWKSGSTVYSVSSAVTPRHRPVSSPHQWNWACGQTTPFDGPVVEVHLSDVDAREEWRRHSVLEGIATDRIKGDGVDGYRQALELLAKRRDA